jgi:hypothetical protein
MHEFVVDAQRHEIDGDIADGSFTALETGLGQFRRQIAATAA